MITLFPNSQPRPILVQIMASLSARFARLNRHYEGTSTDSFTHFRCWHEHSTLIEAVKCANSQGIPGWYCFAVEFGAPRELTDAEDEQVRAHRFGSSSNS